MDWKPHKFNPIKINQIIVLKTTYIFFSFSENSDVSSNVSVSARRKKSHRKKKKSRKEKHGEGNFSWTLFEKHSFVLPHHLVTVL